MTAGRTPPPPPGGRFSREPLKSLYILTTLVWCLYLIPFWILLSLIPAWRPRKSWSIKRCIYVRLIRNICAIIEPTRITLGRSADVAVELSSLRQSEFVWIPPAGPSLIKGFIKDIADEVGVTSVKVPGYWFTSPFEAVPRGTPIKREPYRAKPNELVVLHFHGGAYVLGSAHESYACTEISKLLLAQSPVKRTFVVDYRLAADAPLPAQLLDAISGYVYLIEQCHFDPSRIIIAGDSAGGNLALSLLSYLCAEKVLPLPGGLLLLSPWCDPSYTFKNAHPKGSWVKNKPSDVLENTMGPYALRCLMRGHDPLTICHPFFSPSAWPHPIPKPVPRSKQFVGFPPTLVVAGEAECLRDEIRELVLRMKQGGVRVQHVEEQDVLHDHLTFTFMEPERTQTMARISKWISETVR